MDRRHMNSGTNMSNMDEWFHETEESALVSRYNNWIERAVIQRNPRIKLALIHSVPLEHDYIDKILLSREILN